MQLTNRNDNTPQDTVAVNDVSVEVNSPQKGRGGERLSTALDLRRLPPILAGHDTAAMRKRVQQFYLLIEELFERWVTRRSSPHTQRNYRQDIMALIRFLGITWPADALQLFNVAVSDVQAWRDWMIENGYAPNTLNRRVSSVSSFYKYLQAAAAEMRLPITVPNPAHAQFISRASRDPVKETKAMSATRARQLMALPEGDDVIAVRDRAILKFYLYSAARISAGCRLRVSDFHVDGEEATMRLCEKGDKRRTIGLHYVAAEAIREYIRRAEISRGPLFRPRVGPHSKQLANRHFTAKAMYELIMAYIEQLPGAVDEGVDENGEPYRECIYTPHSMRATGATELLNAGVDIMKVKELLGHRHVTTTQVYDKRRRSTAESASHEMPF